MRREVLIVGGGRVGRHTAQGLIPERYRVTIVEQDSKKCDSLASYDVDEVICGDGTDESVLEEAGIENATVVAGLTNDTETNRTLAEHTRAVNPDAKTIVRIAHDGQQELGHLQFIDHIVYPAAAGADEAVGEITKL